MDAEVRLEFGLGMEMEADLDPSDFEGREEELGFVVVPEEVREVCVDVIMIRRALFRCKASERDIDMNKYQGSYRTTREHAVGAV